MAKTKIKVRGRVKNPAWVKLLAFGGKLFKGKTDKEAQKFLADHGFETSVVNVYLMRKRLAAKGMDVLCPKSKLRPRKVKVVETGNTQENQNENDSLGVTVNQ